MLSAALCLFMTRCGRVSMEKVSFVWTLDSERVGHDGCSGASGEVISRQVSVPALPRPRSRTTTSVHLVQWQTQPRARDEVLVRVKGQPRVKLNRVFEVIGYGVGLVCVLFLLVAVYGLWVRSSVLMQGGGGNISFQSGTS